MLDIPSTFTVANFEQPSNALSPIFSTPAGMVNSVKAVQPLNADAPMLNSERQRLAVMRCREALADALAALHAGFTLDAVNVGIDDALTALLELSGQRTTEAVVNEVFARFCVGK